MSQTQPQPQPHSKTKPLSPPKKKLIVLCDGTWCGMETNTQTNIYRLAEMIMGGHNPFNTSPTNPYIDPVRQIIACYFPGGGIGGTFLEYLFNGATGSDIDQDCEEVYRYIVQHYTRDHEIWMFGLSRGAYTVRCVAGMINNCGILTLPNIGLCNHVYQTYRSRGQTDHPADPNMAKFRTLNSHPVPTPVKFMGLLDTVGSLGIPYLAPGIGLDFHEFYNTEISAVVEKVYHAMSIHDRLWGFEPCHAVPSRGRLGPNFEIHERWFPGCHYDIGRQRFRFLRNGRTFLERALGFILNPLSNVIEPNHVFADVVLKWMLNGIALHAPPNTVIPSIPGIPAIIGQLETDMMNPMRNTGNGDIYDNLPAFGPAGRLWGYLTAIIPARLIPGFTATITALTQTRNRRIEDPTSVLTLYYQPCNHLGGNTIGTLGQIGPAVPRRYPSSTYEDFVTALRLSGTPINTASSPC